MKIKRVMRILLATLLLTACGSGASGSGLSGAITAVGSSALLPLVEQAAQSFQANHPDVMINVQGGGSGQGLSQIIAGTVEIGNSDIFVEEKKIDPAKYDLVDERVAIVGFAPIANKNVGVDNISQEDLIRVFTGQVTNWKELGGNDLPIVVINRASGSGSRAVFERYGLNGAMSMTAQEQDNSGTVRKLVAETPGAISYVAFSYFSDQITVLSIDGVAPSREAIEHNTWRLWAYEHMYTKRDRDAVTEAFIAYMYSEEVQERIIPELGYIPVTGMTVERDAEGNVTPIKEKE